MNYRDGLTMKFPVPDLRVKLETNRGNHANIVKESKEGYLVALRKELAQKLKKLRKGETINPNSKLPVPGDNLDEYDTAIEMLKFTSDDHVVLTQSQFHAYVLDKWDWQKNFLDTASAYSVSGSMYLANNSW